MLVCITIIRMVYCRDLDSYFHGSYMPVNVLKGAQSILIRDSEIIVAKYDFTNVDDYLYAVST